MFTADICLYTVDIILEYSPPNYRLGSNPPWGLASSQSRIGSRFATVLFGIMACLLYPEAQLEKSSETMHPSFTRLSVAGKPGAASGLRAGWV